jgi:four helix bundle protein
MKDFRKLAVWEKAHSLTLAVYRPTAAFPHEEMYGLTSQIRRAAASIPANIAEGCCRSGDGEFRRFLHYAAGSTSELEYHLLLAKDLDFLNEQQYKRLNDQLSEVKRILITLIVKLKAKS